MTSSSIPSVLSGFIAAVTADSGLGNNGAGIAIIEGIPPDRPEMEFLAIGGVAMTQRWAALNRITRPREEDYLIGCRLSCRDIDNNTPAKVRARIFDLLARVEAIVRNAASQPVWGVPNVWQVELVQLTYEPFVDSDTRQFSADLAFSVHITARI